MAGNSVFSAQAVTRRGILASHLEKFQALKSIYFQVKIPINKPGKSFQLKGENERRQAKTELKGKSSILSLQPSSLLPWVLGTRVFLLRQEVVYLVLSHTLWAS